MTVKQHLTDKANAYIAKELWQKMSSELNNRIERGELGDEHERFPWIAKRVKEILEEYLNEEKPKN